MSSPRMTTYAVRSLLAAAVPLADATQKSCVPGAGAVAPPATGCRRRGRR